MGFELSSPIALDIQIWASCDPTLELRQKEVLRIIHNIIIFKNWSQKSVTNLEKAIVIEFDLFITVGI